MENPNLLIQLSKEDLRQIIGSEIETRLKNHLNKQTDRWVKRQEAAEILRVTLPVVDKLLNDGTLPKYKVSGRILIKYSDLQKVVEEVNQLY